MYGRTNAGGGGASPFAFIFVTYPAGAVCTATDGSRVLKLNDTSGYGVFYPPNIGTWTVTATDGAKSASKTVEITKEGQNVSVELSFGIYLFKPGETAYTWQTGNFKYENIADWTNVHPTVSPQSDGTVILTLSAPSKKAYSGVYELSENIDLTNISYLVFEGSGNIPTGGFLDLAVFDPSKRYNPCAASASISPTDTKVTLDVTAITGSWRVGFIIAANGWHDTGTTSLHIYSLMGEF